MKSYGEFVGDVIYGLVDGFYNLVTFCVLLLAGILAGWVVGMAGEWLDTNFLHWRWSSTSWAQIGICGVLGYFTCLCLAPVVLDTLRLLLHCAGVLAAIAGLLAFLMDTPFVPLAVHIGVWFFPAVFVLWLSHCLAVRR